MKPQPDFGPFYAVDVIRFMSALAVVLFHFTCYAWMPADWQPVALSAIGTTPQVEALVPLTWMGWVGVEVFFVISGFVIILSAQGKTPYTFFVGRALRILPTLFFFTSLTLLVTLRHSNDGLATTLILFAKSIFLFPRGPWIDGVIWTLTVEVFFYTIVFLLMQFRLYKSIEMITYAWGAVTSVLLIALFFIYVLAANSVTSARAAEFEKIYALRFFLITTGPFFAAGSVMAFIARDGFNKIRVMFLVLFGLSSCIAIYFSALELPIVAQRHYSPIPVILTWLGAILIMLATIAPKKKLELSPVAKEILRTLGLISFPLYLLHNITGAWVLGIVGASVNNPYLSIALCIMLLIAICYVYLKLIEPYLKQGLAFCIDRIAGAFPRWEPVRVGRPCSRAFSAPEGRRATTTARHRGIGG